MSWARRRCCCWLIWCYREASGSYRACFLSWTYVHNDTGRMFSLSPILGFQSQHQADTGCEHKVNIYTHIIGALMFLVLPIYFFNTEIPPRYALATIGDKAVFLTYLGGVAVCFCLSATWVKWRTSENCSYQDKITWVDMRGAATGTIQSWIIAMRLTCLEHSWISRESFYWCGALQYHWYIMVSIARLHWDTLIGL